MMDEDIDPCTLEIIKPEEKIIINKQKYNIKSIYRWVIYLKNVKDPLRNNVTDDDRQRIVNTYNNLPLSEDEIKCIINHLLNNKLKYESLSLRLRSNREVTLTAVKKLGSYLAFVPEKFRDDKEIVLTAVSKWGLSLENVSNNLKNDPEIARPWNHILRIWSLYRMGLAMGLIENLARYNFFGKSCHLFKGNLSIKDCVNINVL